MTITLPRRPSNPDFPEREEFEIASLREEDRMRCLFIDRTQDWLAQMGDLSTSVNPGAHPEIPCEIAAAAEDVCDEISDFIDHFQLCQFETMDRVLEVVDSVTRDLCACRQDTELLWSCIVRKFPADAALIRSTRASQLAIIIEYPTRPGNIYAVACFDEEFTPFSKPIFGGSALMNGWPCPLPLIANCRPGEKVLTVSDSLLNPNAFVYNTQDWIDANLVFDEREYNAFDIIASAVPPDYIRRSRPIDFLEMGETSIEEIRAQAGIILAACLPDNARIHVQLLATRIPGEARIDVRLYNEYCRHFDEGCGALVGYFLDLSQITGQMFTDDDEIIPAIETLFESISLSDFSTHQKLEGTAQIWSALQDLGYSQAECAALVESMPALYEVFRLEAKIQEWTPGALLPHKVALSAH